MGSERPPIEIRPTGPEDREFMERFTVERWGSPVVVAHGTVYRPEELPGFLALSEGKTAGLLTYRIEGGSCEIVTLNSTLARRGAGSALIEAVRDAARRNGCFRLWLITTNDNVDALRFYQKRGFELVRIHRNAVNRSRELKPEIPEVAENGIPIRDEIELEMWLKAR
jgi:GNAT superfamily N-acetyltransferase